MIAKIVILYPSVCFITNQLHTDRTVHNNSGGGLLTEVLKDLVHSDVLMECPRGVKSAARSTKVFIKRIPLENEEDEKDFVYILSKYSDENVKPITIDMYRKSCEVINLAAVGVVHEDVYKLLRRAEYGTRDLSVLSLLPKVGTKKCGSTISIFDNDNGMNTNIFVN